MDGQGVHPPAGVVVLHLLFCLLLFSGLVHLIFVGAHLPGAVSPHTTRLFYLRPRKTGVTRGADPQPFSWMNVSNYRSLLGARAADHEAAFPAVVSTLGHGELV